MSISRLSATLKAIDWPPPSNLARLQAAVATVAASQDLVRRQVAPVTAAKIKPYATRVLLGTVTADQVIRELVGDEPPGPKALWWSIMLTCATLWLLFVAASSNGEDDP